MLKKILVVLGVTAMMISVVGCEKKEDSVAETTSIYKQTYTESIELCDEITNESVSVYIDTFEELFGEDFDINQITYDAETNEVSYKGQSVSWDYVEELACNNMVDNF